MQMKFCRRQAQDFKNLNGVGMGEEDAKMRAKLAREFAFQFRGMREN